MNIYKATVCWLLTHYCYTIILASSPSLRDPVSAAWPTGNIVLTKMPMLPLGESIPPTTLKPRPFLPPPFSKYTEWRVMERDFGLAATGVWCERDRGLATTGICWELRGLLLSLLSTVKMRYQYQHLDQLPPTWSVRKV